MGGEKRVPLCVRQHSVTIWQQIPRILTQWRGILPLASEFSEFFKTYHDLVRAVKTGGWRDKVLGPVMWREARAAFPLGLLEEARMEEHMHARPSHLLPGGGGAAPLLTSCPGLLNSLAAQETRTEPVTGSAAGSLGTSPSPEGKERRGIGWSQPATKPGSPP